jgi:hypothetical protein
LPSPAANPCFLGGSLGPADHGLALCAATDGRPDEARRLFDTALAQCARWRMPGVAARVRLDRARLLAGTQGDQPLARADAGLAAAEAHRLGMHAVAREAHALSEHLALA